MKVLGISAFMLIVLLIFIIGMDTITQDLSFSNAVKNAFNSFIVMDSAEVVFSVVLLFLWIGLPIYYVYKKKKEKASKKKKTHQS